MLAEVLGRYSRSRPIADRVRQIRAALNERQPRTAELPVAERQALAKRLPPEQLDIMVQKYLSGEGCTVLSHWYGASENGVIAHLKRRGVPIRPRGKLSTADRDEIRRLRDAGWSIQSIADQFAVTRSAVSRHLTRD